MRNYLHVLVTFGSEFVHFHVGTCVAEKQRVFGQQVVPEEPPDGGVDLLPRQIALEIYLKNESVVTNGPVLLYFQTFTVLLGTLYKKTKGEQQEIEGTLSRAPCVAERRLRFSDRFLMFF